MTNWTLQNASGKGLTWAEATSAWSTYTVTWASLGATAWTDATKAVSSWLFNEYEAGGGYIYDYIGRNYDVSGTLYNYEDAPTVWSYQNKN